MANTHRLMALPLPAHAVEAATVTRRLTGIDRVKAAAIIAVVATHAGPADPVWRADWSTFDAWARLTWNVFAVPAFLQVAGMLYQHDRPWTVCELRDRLARVLVPYVVVSLAFLLGGVEPWASDPWIILTGGPYYYVPLVAECILIGFVLSHCPRAVAWLLLGACVMFVAIRTYDPFILFTSTFTMNRVPFYDFALGHFLCGWLGFPRWLAERVPRSWLLVGALTCLGGFIATVGNGTVPRAGYTLLVVAWLLAGTWAPPGLRLLSDVTLCVYLVQEPLSWVLTQALRDLHAVPRFGAIVTLATGAGVGVAVAARRALGRERARFWLGA